MADSARALHLSAVELVNRGRIAEAIGLLKRAQESADDPDVRARVAGTLGLAHARTGAIEAGDRLCVEALRIPGISADTTALLVGQRGSIASYAGRLDDAVALLSSAIATVADPTRRANLLINRANIHMQRQAYDEAAADTATAAAVYAERGMVVDEAEARHNLGYISLLRGDLVGALHEMSAARARLAAESPTTLAVSDVDRAQVLRDAGLADEAERILASSAMVFGAQRLPQDRGETEVALARSQLTHDPAAAARTASAAARRFRAIGNETWAARAEAVRVRALLAGGAVGSGAAPSRSSRPPSAVEVETVAAALHRAGLQADAVAVRLAGQLRAVRSGSAAPASPRLPANAPIDVRLLAREVRVARAASARREADVRRHAAAGIEELAAWQASFGSLDLQASIAMHGVPLLMAGLSSALRSGRPDVVFEWSERARHATQQVVPLRPPPDEETAAALAELRMLRTAAADGDWLANPRAAELHDRVRERQWSSTGTARLEDRVPLPEVQAALGADTALLAYVWSEGVLACLVVRGESARTVPVPDWPGVRAALTGLRADLDVSAAVRSGPMAAVVRRALDERLAALSARLLDGPMHEAGDARRIVLTVPGVLAGIPWAMLPAMRGRVLTLAASASRWTRLRGIRPSGSRAAGIAVGPRVARGDEEADAAAGEWTRAGRGATVLRGAAATVDAVAALAADVAVLHVAAHGRHASENPLFSGLELADGALFGYDIDRIPRLPDTVVLSSCEVGRSSVRWGEEAVGMTRTWLHAGTRCVIAAPVVVADDEACELLGAVHAGLAAGEPPAEALAAASAATGLVTPFECHGAGF